MQTDNEHSESIGSLLKLDVFFLQNKPQLVEPIDFESFILKNKTLLQNDPQRELLLYPPDDISVCILNLIIHNSIHLNNVS